MTRQAFEAHCTYTLGLTTTETDEWWEELYNNPHIERDNAGFRGREQLWIPNAMVMRERSKVTGMRDSVSEGNKDIKNPKPEDNDMLTQHMLGQKRSLADTFLKEADQSGGFTKRKCGPVEAASSSQQPLKASKNKVKDGPKCYKQMEKERCAFSLLAASAACCSFLLYSSADLVLQTKNPGLGARSG